MRLWQHGVANTAQALAAVLTRSVGEADLDVVLTARAAVLDHIETVLGDLVPRARPDRPKIRRRVVPLAGVETDPIGSLGLGRVSRVERGWCAILCECLVDLS